VENLPEREIPPTDWNMIRRNIPVGIMNVLALKLLGPKFLAGTALSTAVGAARYLKGGQQRGYRREFEPPW
jgi:hypothetical protein